MRCSRTSFHQTGEYVLLVLRSVRRRQFRSPSPNMPAFRPIESAACNLRTRTPRCRSSCRLSPVPDEKPSGTSAEHPYQVQGWHRRRHNGATTQVSRPSCIPRARATVAKRRRHHWCHSRRPNSRENTRGHSHRRQTLVPGAGHPAPRVAFAAQVGGCPTGPSLVFYRGSGDVFRSDEPRAEG